MDSTIQYNKELEDNDSLLTNQLGQYSLYGIDNTILYSEYLGEDIVGQEEQQQQPLIPISNVIQFLGVHNTISGESIDDSVKDLNSHSLIPKDQLNLSINTLKSLIKEKSNNNNTYILSFIIVKETEEEIRQSPMLFYRIKLQNLECKPIENIKKLEFSSFTKFLNDYSLRLFRICSLNPIPISKLTTNENIYFTVQDSNKEELQILPPNSDKLVSSYFTTPSEILTTLVPYFKISSNQDNVLTAPLMELSIKNKSNSNNSSRNISVFCIVSTKSTIKNINLLFNRAVKSQVRSGFRGVHLQPSSLLLPITVEYYCDGDNGKVDDDDKRNKEIRKKVYKRLGISSKRPVLRSMSEMVFYSSGKLDSNPVTTFPKETTDRIRDVHLNLDLSSKFGDDGKVSLVQGSYDYYHYMQDGIDDNGWGCAYRSMQTICSWIQIQKLSNKAVSSHKDIQSMLVQMKDKESSFIGSKQWIGAFEINLCLQELYQLDCKILNVKSGKEVPEKVRELSNHFERYGTPIMIGGGVLAYTLLGVDYNESTGESRYLILDPHYTGTETIKTIKEKGWCGWKNPDLFRKDAFYNFCMPLIPNDI